MKRKGFFLTGFLSLFLTVFFIQTFEDPVTGEILFSLSGRSAYAALAVTINEGSCSYVENTTTTNKCWTNFNSDAYSINGLDSSSDTLSVAYTGGTKTGYAFLQLDGDEDPVGATAVSATSGTVSFAWSAICAAFDSGTCDPGEPGNSTDTAYLVLSENATYESGDDERDSFNIRIDSKAPTGVITELALYPGEQRLYLDLTVPSDYATNGDGETPVDKYAFLYRPLAESTVSPHSASDAPVSVFDDDNDARYLENLTNETIYCVSAALVDAAGNYGTFSEFDTTGSNDTCKAPSEVYGVLSENDCFIATATWGDSDAGIGRIDVFKRFRNEVLLGFETGRKFVSFYYSNSPQWATFLKESPVLRNISSIVLFPIYWICLAVLEFGTAYVAMGALMLLLLTGLGVPVVLRAFKRV